MKLICKKYCRYFKENRNDEKGCYPISLIKKVPFYYFPQESFKHTTDFDELKSIFCPNCDYQRNDCDFQRESNPGPPCGGYIYFQHILSKGLIDIDDIRRICEIS